MRVPGRRLTGEDIGVGGSALEILERLGEHVPMTYDEVLLHALVHYHTLVMVTGRGGNNGAGEVSDGK